MDLTEEEIQKILRLVDELDYGEIHLEIGDLKLHLVKQRPSGDQPSQGSGSPTAQSRAARRSESRDSTEGSPSTNSAHDNEEIATAPMDGAHVVVAPIAGTFYRAPAPGAKPFVEIGQHVAASAPVCLLEVMKLFQSIPAGVGGKVVQVLVANATAVVRGQALFAIEPDSAP
ncbi:MAG TPA: biotin/lipoyl-containing protein [Casimicrobiaceae bacterium]